MSIKSKIRTIENYPIEGVMFRDITTLFEDPDGLHEAIDLLLERYKDLKIDKIAAIEARGFLLGAPLAYLLNVGLVLIRKPGKLPAKTIDQEYELEYGSDRIEVHEGAIEKGERILIVDDEGTYRQIKLSVYNKLLHEEQLKNITEIRTVLDTPPEAKRY